MKATHGLAFVLIITGGLNWLLVGLTGWDIGMIFGGQGAPISRIIYILVGLSAFYLVSTHRMDCKPCEKKVVSTGATIIPPSSSI